MFGRKSVKVIEANIDKIICKTKREITQVKAEVNAAAAATIDERKRKIVKITADRREILNCPIWFGRPSFGNRYSDAWLDADPYLAERMFQCDLDNFKTTCEKTIKDIEDGKDKQLSRIVRESNRRIARLKVKVARAGVNIEVAMFNTKDLIRLTPEEVYLIQLTRLMKLGYPKAAKMTNKEFANLVPMPEDEPGALLVVSPKVVSIVEQMRLIGGVNYLNLAKVKDIFEIDKLIYWCYEVDDGKTRMGKSAKDCFVEFKEVNRRGQIIAEAVALITQKPDTLSNYSIDIPGSRFGARNVAHLSLFHGGLSMLYGNLFDYAHPRCGSASCRN